MLACKFVLHGCSEKIRVLSVPTVRSILTKKINKLGLQNITPRGSCSRVVLYVELGSVNISESLIYHLV